MLEIMNSAALAFPSRGSPKAQGKKTNGHPGREWPFDVEIRRKPTLSWLLPRSQP